MKIIKYIKQFFQRIKNRKKLKKKLQIMKKTDPFIYK